MGRVIRGTPVPDRLPPVLTEFIAHGRAPGPKAPLLDGQEGVLGGIPPDASSALFAEADLSTVHPSQQTTQQTMGSLMGPPPTPVTTHKPSGLANHEDHDDSMRGSLRAAYDEDVVFPFMHDTIPRNMRSLAREGSNPTPQPRPRPTGPISDQARDSSAQVAARPLPLHPGELMAGLRQGYRDAFSAPSLPQPTLDKPNSSPHAEIRARPPLAQDNQAQESRNNGPHTCCATEASVEALALGFKRLALGLAKKGIHPVHESLDEDGSDEVSVTQEQDGSLYGIDFDKKPTKFREQSEKDFASAIRDMTMSLLGRAKNTDPFPALSFGEVRYFEVTKEGGPTAMHFRVDCSTTSSTAWNKRAGEIVVDCLIAKSTLPREQRKRALSRYVDYHNKTLRRQYEKIHLRQEHIRTEGDRQAARRSRKITLVAQRIQTASKYEELKALAVLLKRVGHKTSLHSEDESDHAPGLRLYNSIDPAWRNPDVGRYFRLLDLLYSGAKMRVQDSADGGLAASPGNWTRIRRTKGKTAAKWPHGGLPENFYDPKWYAEQSDAFKAALKVGPVMLLTHSLTLRRQAAAILMTLDLMKRGTLVDPKTISITSVELGILDRFLETGHLPSDCQTGGAQAPGTRGAHPGDPALDVQYPLGDVANGRNQGQPVAQPSSLHDAPAAQSAHAPTTGYSQRAAPPPLVTFPTGPREVNAPRATDDTRQPSQFGGNSAGAYSRGGDVPTKGGDQHHTPPAWANHVPPAAHGIGFVGVNSDANAQRPSHLPPPVAANVLPQSPRLYAQQHPLGWQGQTPLSQTPYHMYGPQYQQPNQWQHLQSGQVLPYAMQAMHPISSQQQPQIVQSPLGVHPTHPNQQGQGMPSTPADEHNGNDGTAFQSRPPDPAGSNIAHFVPPIHHSTGTGYSQPIWGNGWQQWQPQNIDQVQGWQWDPVQGSWQWQGGFGYAGA
ncbi:unnamed protein product [Peniophora sp. CBMAI 1063]|nr:unnamed protein product [Peniophora sp. CBMAI 1063]